MKRLLRYLAAWRKRTDRRTAWLGLQHEVIARQRLLKAAYRNLLAPDPAGTTVLEPLEKDYRRALRLASVDVFVEKAQKLLGDRARKLAWSGIAATILAVGIMITTALLVSRLKLSEVLDGNHRLDNGYVLTWLLLRGTAITGLVGGAVVFLVHLARAFFHEMTVLLSRRHSLRFGRLFVYISDTNPTLLELERAFRWNEDVSTAFKDIKPEMVMPKGLARGLSDVSTSAAKKAIRMVNRSQRPTKARGTQTAKPL